MKKEQKKTPIWTTLYNYCNKRVIYFDVPGHKKSYKSNIMSHFLIDTFKYDINSSPEVDNLAHPIGVIKEGHNLLAKAFQADEAYILTNGSTQGIHTLITASVYPGEKILIPRNSHKSVINGIILAGAIPIFINPVIDDYFGIAHNISLSELKKVFRKNPDVKALLLLNPTYFGVVSNLKQIVKFCREKKISILTDEAHGAHFQFHTSFPKTGMQAGADGSALSFHKTLGSLTQSSILLWKEIDANGVKGIPSKYIWQWNSIFTTTSPSFLLMASVDAARSQMACEGQRLFSNALALAKYAREELKKIDGITILGKEHIGFQGAYKLDETKLVIKVDELGYSGFDFYEELRVNYNIQLELSEVKVCMALISFMDTKESIDLLINAIKDIATNKRKVIDKEAIIIKPLTTIPKRVVSPREALTKPVEEVNYEEAAGRISADSVMYYPPGIPLILPGEVISREIIRYYKKLVDDNARIITAASDSNKFLVLRDLRSSEK